MEKSLFDYTDYKRYLDAVIASRPGKGRGIRAELADRIGCQRAFVSQVLQGHAHFNLEHGDKINSYLGHSEEEGHFFLLLIQLARAGTESLREYFRKQMQIVLDRRLVLKQRLPAEDKLSLEDSLRYYSSWLFGAVRVATTIPKLRTRETIARKLGLTVEELMPILEFLVSRGLLETKGTEYLPTTRHMHLGSDSTLIAKHHTNWRVRALTALEREGPKDVHYSSVVSIAREDAQKIKALIVDSIEKVQTKVEKSVPEETLFSFCLDFYEL